MRSWMIAACFCLAVASVTGAQDDEAAKANALWLQGKKLDALPLYEDLYAAHPKEWLYAERLASALGAKLNWTNDPAEVKALRTRMRDVAKRAVELGDPNYFVQMMANTDPDAPRRIAGAACRGCRLRFQAQKRAKCGGLPVRRWCYLQGRPVGGNEFFRRLEVTGRFHRQQ